MQYTKADIRKVGSFEETTSGLWFGAYRDIFCWPSLLPVLPVKGRTPARKS